MRNKAALLEELASVLNELSPLMRKDDKDGVLLHQELDIPTDENVIKKLTDEVRQYISSKL